MSGGQQGFLYRGGIGGVPPPLAKNLLIPPPQGKVLPVDSPPNFYFPHQRFIPPLATNKGEHWNAIVYINNLRFCYSVNVFLIVLHICLSICYSSLIVVCEAIATLVFCLYGCVGFTVCFSEINSKFFLLFICLCLVFSLPCVTLLGQFIEPCFYGIFTFILVLNIFKNIFEISLKNTQNKTTVIYLLFATIRYFWFASVCKSRNFLALNASYLLS